MPFGDERNYEVVTLSDETSADRVVAIAEEIIGEKRYFCIGTRGQAS